jgi:hypothetical protein
MYCPDEVEPSDEAPTNVGSSFFNNDVSDSGPG